MRAALRLVYATIPALIILGFFTYFANWIPQTRWQPPEKRQVGQVMSPTELAKLGQAIAKERGCMACHTLEPGVGAKGGGRGPNIYGLALRRASGVPGGTTTLVDYLVQSLYDPSAYVVDSYPDIMPAATAPPAKLTYEEVVAVVNYLQSLGGRPTVRVGDIPRPPAEGVALPAPGPAPKATPAPQTEVTPTAPPPTPVATPVLQQGATPAPQTEVTPTAPPPTPVATPVLQQGATPTAPQPTPAATPSPRGPGGAALVEKYGCSACHVIGGKGGNLGPSLDSLPQVAGQRVAGLSAEEYVSHSILAPDAFVVTGFVPGLMPSYNGKISAEELKALVQYLLSGGRE